MSDYDKPCPHVPGVTAPVWCGECVRAEVERLTRERDEARDRALGYAAEAEDEIRKSMVVVAERDALAARLAEAEGRLRSVGGVLLVALDPLPPDKECGALCESCGARFREQFEAIAAFLAAGAQDNG